TTAVGLDATRIIAAGGSGLGRILLHDGVLDVALVALVEVDVVVIVAGQHDVPGIDGAAEPLDAIIEIAMHLHVLQVGAVAHAHQGQAVDLVVGSGHAACLGDAYITQGAAVVGRVVAAVIADLIPAFAFHVADRTRAVAGGAGADGVLGCEALDHHAAPLTLAVEVGILAREGDRRVGRAIGDELRTTGHQQYRISRGPDAHARADGQRHAGRLRGCDVGIIRQRDIAGTDPHDVIDHPVGACYQDVVLRDVTGDCADASGATHEWSGGRLFVRFGQRSRNRPFRPPGSGGSRARRDRTDVGRRIEREA